MVSLMDTPGGGPLRGALMACLPSEILPESALQAQLQPPVILESARWTAVDSDAAMAVRGPQA